jgi:predicted Rossmann-fold nucleotide-binding protein
MSPDAHPVLGIFASDHGPGDAERASIMSQAGSYFARKGAHIVCLGDDETLPVPLLTSARAAGGKVTLITGPTFHGWPALQDIPVERLATADERLRRLAVLSNLYVALPGSLASASALFMTWARGGGGAGRKPVVFYDRNGAFRVLRGYTSDIISNSVKRYDQLVQFGDSIEDVWNKIVWLIDTDATALSARD